jgi:uncharacterized protein YbjT (DUF2867 family)
MKTALVFGSTGLVGSCLLKELSEKQEYSEIKSFVRKPSGHNYPKVLEHVIDFGKLENSRDLFKGNDLFICLGTTLKKAGSVAKVEEIDRDIPLKIAEICVQNGVQKIAVVSSIGANKDSKNYYLRIKGELEAGVSVLNFHNIAILRPSLLLGDRNEKRFGETAGKVFMQLFGFLFFGRIKKYRAIHARTVARAMIEILFLDLKDIIFESDAIQLFGA